MNTRRTFLATGLTAAGGLTLWNSKSPAQESNSEKPQPIDKLTVAKFVGKSHGDLDAVKAMLNRDGSLVNATWDWGNGDFETGLGAASHVGRGDIAQYLLEHGSRLDVFAATMLGIQGIVAESLKAFPEIHAVPGPHGIPLLSHAIVGRDPKADDVFALLLTAGADVNAKSNMEMTPLMAGAGVGKADIVEMLLANGADPTAKDAKGRDALELAQKRKHDDVVKLLENALKKNG